MLKRASDIHPDSEIPVLGSPGRRVRFRVRDYWQRGFGTQKNPAASLKRFAGRVTSSDASTCTETTDGIIGVFVHRFFNAAKIHRPTKHLD